MTNDTGIYVTGCVIPNGLPDHEGDILNKKDIKIILTKFLEHQTDTEHNYLKNNGVDYVENGISEIDRDIAGKTAPAGSWLVTFYITNSQIIDSILSTDPKSINGLSLGSVPQNLTDIQYWFINKNINYRDVETEEVIPKYISFVARPSNGFGLEVENYDVYINKSIDEEFKMTNKQIETPIEEEKLTLSGWERVIKGFQSLGINKSETGATETKQEVKVETKPAEKNEEPAGISNEELAKKIDNIPNAVTTGIVEAFKEIGANQATEPVKSEEPEKEEGEGEGKSEVKEPAQKTKEEGIQKSATQRHENTDMSNPNKTTNFYEKSGRDMWGCRIRK